MSSSKSTTQQTTTSAPDSTYSNAAWQNYADAQNAMANWNPTAVPLPQAFNQQQLAAQSMATNLANSDPNGGYTGQAGQLFTQAGNYKPLNIAAQAINAPTMGPAASASSQGYNAQTGTASKIDPSVVKAITANTIDPAQMNAADLKKYEAMIDPTASNSAVSAFLADNQRANQMALQPNATAAAQQGAFGGTRQAVLDSLTNEGYARTAADTTSQMELNLYNQGLANYQADLARQQQASTANAGNQLTAAQSNQGAQYNVANSNATLAQQMAMANMSAQNQASQFGAGAANTASLQNAQTAQQQALAQAQMQMQAGMANAGNDLTAQQANQAAGFNAANLGMTAGSNLANLGQTVRSNTLDNANLLGQVGQQNYTLTAAQQQAAYQNALNAANAPLMKNQFLQGALGAIPYGTTTTGEGSTTSSPSLLSTLMQLGGTGAQMFAASDVRLKHNVRPMKGGLDAVRKLRPVTYNWNKGGVPDLGFTAQNVEKVMPDAVREFGGVKHINIPAVMGLLAHSVQQLDRKVNQQRRAA